MNIAFLINDITRFGGTERITITLANSFLRHGHHVTIISNLREYSQLHFNLDSSIKVLYVHPIYRKREKRLSRMIEYLKTILLLRKILKNNHFDLIIGQSFPMNAMLYFANGRVKQIACEHIFYSYYESKILRAFRIFLYRRVSIVVVLNTIDYKHFEKYIHNVRLIPNMNYLKLSTTQSSLKNKIIISAGRLNFQKGFDLLIEAMSIVAERHKDWVLHIYGKGACKEQLEKQIRLLHLEKNVILKGNSHNLSEAYLNSSIYVLPSRFEGFGLVLIEAASFGLPIVSFDCPSGPSDILNNDLGVLVPNGDVQQLAKSIMRMIEEPQLRFSYARKGKDIVEKYDEERIYPLWNELFCSLICSV